MEALRRAGEARADGAAEQRAADADAGAAALKAALAECEVLRAETARLLRERQAAVDEAAATPGLERLPPTPSRKLVSPPRYTVPSPLTSSSS